MVVDVSVSSSLLSSSNLAFLMGTAAVFFFGGRLEPEGFLILTLDLTDDNDGVFFFFWDGPDI